MEAAPVSVLAGQQDGVEGEDLARIAQRARADAAPRVRRQLIAAIIPVVALVLILTTCLAVMQWR